MLGHVCLYIHQTKGRLQVKDYCVLQVSLSLSLTLGSMIVPPRRSGKQRIGSGPNSTSAISRMIGLSRT